MAPAAPTSPPTVPAAPSPLEGSPTTLGEVVEGNGTKPPTPDATQTAAQITEAQKNGDPPRDTLNDLASQGEAAAPKNVKGAAPATSTAGAIASPELPVNQNPDRPAPTLHVETEEETQRINALLRATGRALYDLRDRRLPLVVLAQQSRPDTPLGTQLRRDVLRVMQDINPDDFEQAQRRELLPRLLSLHLLDLPRRNRAIGMVRSVHQNLSEHPIAEIPLQQNAFTQYLEQDKNREPLTKALEGTAVAPAALIDAAKQGKFTDQWLELLAKPQFGGSEFSTALLKQITSDGHLPNLYDPEMLLQSAGLERNFFARRSAQKAAQELLLPPTSIWKMLRNRAGLTLLGSIIAIVMITQFSSESSGGQQSH